MVFKDNVYFRIKGKELCEFYVAKCSVSLK